MDPVGFDSRYLTVLCDCTGMLMPSCGGPESSVGGGALGPAGRLLTDGMRLDPSGKSAWSRGDARAYRVLCSFY